MEELRGQDARIKAAQPDLIYHTNGSGNAQ